MSRLRDTTRVPLLQKQNKSATDQSGSCKQAARGDEKTPLLNSMNDAAESLMNNSVMRTDMQTGVSWGMAAFLLVNTALGAGMLNYPYAYNQIGGVLAAALMQVILLVLITSTMFILVYCADFNRDDTYHDVLLSMCGKRAQQISASSIMLTCYGINITFLVIIGDQYDRIFNSLLEPQFIEMNWWLDRKFTIFVTSILFIWPMCYAKRLDFLRHASILGMFAMLYVAFLTVYEHYMLDEATIAEAVARHQTMGGDGVKQSVQLNASTTPTTSIHSQKHVQWFEPLAVVPVLCFAYQTHEVIVPVYACMKERFIGSFMKASIFGLIILFFLYNLVGAFGYLTFGGSVGADIMSLYDAKDPIVVVGVVALVIKFITTYPPLMFCGRSALDGLYAEFRSLSTSEFKSHERARRYVISTLWFLSTVALAAFAPDISVTLQLLGSMASINVFVFPGMCLLSLTRRLRKARLALLMGELPESNHGPPGHQQLLFEQQRAKDFYLISGSYFGAAMKKNAALRNQYRQRQQNACTSLCCGRDSPTAMGASSATTSPKQFTATFASLLEFESHLTANGNSAYASQTNGVASSGRGTGEILSSISTPSSTASSTSSTSLATDQRQNGNSSTNNVLQVNGYGSSAMNGADASKHEHQLQQQISQIQRRQEEFERLMMTNSGSCCLNATSSFEGRAMTSANCHHSYSSAGPAAGGGGGTINDSYDDYSDCLERDCLNHNHQQHLHHHQGRRPQRDRSDQPLLISHSQSHQQQQQVGLHSPSRARDDSTAARAGHFDSTSPACQTADTLVQRPIRYHCQHCSQHKRTSEQQSLCLQNSLNYACQQSTTGSLLDKLGSSIAPSTVAQVGITQCTATGLYLFAVFLIVFGVFIFFLELASVFGFL